jgi:hypothetical protein
MREGSYKITAGILPKVYLTFFAENIPGEKTKQQKMKLKGLGLVMSDAVYNVVGQTVSKHLFFKDRDQGFFGVSRFCIFPGIYWIGDTK